MADVTPILIKDLAAQTTLQDTDYFIVGGEDAKKITVGQMKEALGINELNTKIYVEKITGTFTGAEVGDSGYLAIGTRNIGGKTLVPIAAVPAVATLNFKAEIVNTSDFMIHLMMYNGTQIKYDVETDVFVLFVCVA